jgi:hypothetical protein
MDKLDRIQQLHRIFSEQRYPIPTEQLAQRLECSTKTILRNVKLLQDQFNAPLIFNKSPTGWQYQPQSCGKYQLPGLWLTSEELQSLIFLLHLLKNLGKGLLNGRFNGEVHNKLSGESRQLILH